MPKSAARIVAETAKELREEGIFDEWDEALGLRMAQNIHERRRQRVRQNVAVKEAAE